MHNRKPSPYFPQNKLHSEVNRKISAYFTFVGYLITKRPCVPLNYLLSFSESGHRVRQPNYQRLLRPWWFLSEYWRCQYGVE